MYDLGEQFRPDLEKAIVNPDSVIQGTKFRITIMTESLIRFEYSETGTFNDNPTELIWYRNFPKPEFEKKEDKSYLEVTTKYFRLLYTKEKPFDASKLEPTKNLSVKPTNSDKVWYYKHPEARNIGAPGYEISSKKLLLIKKPGDLKLEKGLFSFDGFVSINDSNGMIIKEDGTFGQNPNKEIDVYLFVYGDDFDRCLKDYYSLTGYPALIPRYALGNWWYKNDDYNDSSLKELVDSFRNNGVPLSLILFNKSWHLFPEDNKKNITSGFTFNRQRFQDPVAMINYLHEQGIKVGLPINPFDGLYNMDEYYTQATQYLKTDENGVIPFNVLDPRTIDVYLKLFIHPLDNINVDFYFVDYYQDKKKKEIALLKHYELLDMARNHKRRPMIVGSNTSLAPHRYSVLTSPHMEVSWDDLKILSFYNILSTNIGVSWWSHDIGGFTRGIEDNELYTRFIELGVFSPILKLSSDRGKYYKREPWKWSIKTSTIAKEFLILRHKLIPYLYSEAFKYSKDGIPIIKPVYYTDKHLYDDEQYYNEYYFGSELLVSPITKKKEIVMNRNIHKFYMPEGVWYDFFSGKKFPGGKEYVSFYREQDYPVFAHAGSIIPMGLNENMNDTNPPKDMEIHIFPGKSNTYHLYEDDGVSGLYKKDYFLLTDIDYNYMPNNYTVIIRAIDGKSGIVPPHRNYKIIFRNTKKADEVIVYSNDIKMEYRSYVNGPDFIVEIKDAKTIGQITVNCKGKDIEIDAVRIINSDIEKILSDLQIPTEIKERIDIILFDENLPIPKKRIEIRKLGRYGLEPKFVKLFLKLLEYINQV
ncbi:MAG: DUF5110 domain-containing protein [Bacilli bacterium]|nr:DUF5110 domain-containing protein [Bacilli bacterium]